MPLEFLYVISIKDKIIEYLKREFYWGTIRLTSLCLHERLSVLDPTIIFKLSTA